jgi:hypothetical protein
MKPWTEWKERCAARLCSPASRAALQSFGGQRFRTLAQRCMHTINISDVSLVTLSDPDAWHLLEVHMTLPDAIHGKAYKEWLFARTAGSHDTPFDVVQGGATLLMRSAVREHLRREHLPSTHVSANQPPPSQATTEPRCEEWLPGPLDTRDTVEYRELQSLAAQHADRLFAALPRRLKMTLAARACQLPLSTPGLLELAGCQRSALQTAYREFAERLFDQLRECYRGDDRDTVSDLAVEVFNALTQRGGAWAENDDALKRVLQSWVPQDGGETTA